MQTNNSPLLRQIDQSGVPLLLARLIVGCVFVYMGALKVADPFEFLKAIRQFQMMPETPGLLLNSTAIVLPWLEIFAGVALVLGVFIRGAAAMLIVMLCVFTPAILIRALSIQATAGTPFFDIKFDCGCGGGPVIIWKKLLENFGLIVLAFVAFVSRSRRFTLDLWLSRRVAHSGYCHLCGYAAPRPVAGLCERCATPPAIPAGLSAN